ncbi:zinc-binding dehydrogenase [Microbacterium sp. SORGH_AS_0862]|uniref:zinc-dependent alcohol dehydrogenase n=1 Tax=Microbacterium sp. SORGH_AS_0862 TaxID=3041789 RepID=UPI0027930067|nr:zinc-binding dehydrogenase [Microbacterium sp. SORGH_AS_0862]MDQ1204605.1 2-desacetyl-2-hydroxyethyl bacteriochlorophyllide A dehydrogenase [Microbacterium sp. SORGH_AS_0862]
MSHRAVAVVWTGPGQVDVREVSVPAPGPGQVLIRNLVSLISPGTEAGWLAGPTSHGVLGVTFPFVPGYSRVGRIVAVGEGVSGWELGQRVVAGFDGDGRPLGAHAELSLARAEDLEVVPDGLSSEAAAFFLLGQAACSVVMLAEVRLSDSVAIVGQGPIGQLAVQFARAAGASRVTVFDLVAARREAALAVGAHEAIDPRDEAGTASHQDAYRHTVDLSGAPAGTALAIRTAQPRGTVVLSTGYAGPMEIDYGSVFVKGLRLIGGYVNADPDLARSATRTFLRMVGEGSLDVSGLLSEPWGPQDAVGLYRRILAKDTSLSAPLFRWAAD